MQLPHRLAHQYQENVPAIPCLSHPENPCRTGPVKIVAGLDTDLMVKLFELRADGTLRPLSHGDWVNILDRHRAVMGEVLGVILETKLGRDSR